MTFKNRSCVSGRKQYKFSHSRELELNIFENKNPALIPVDGIYGLGVPYEPMAAAGQRNGACSGQSRYAEAVQKRG